MSKNEGFTLKNLKIKRRYTIALTISIFFFIIYLIFLTNDHFAVDGATRSLEVFWNEKLTLQRSNHILYPFNVYSWYRLTSFFAGESKDPFSFIRRIQIMNALSSSIILALSYLIYLRFLKKETLSLVLVLVFGISNAFFIHAVSSAEPIVGFLFFTISFYLVVSFSKNKKTYAIMLTVSAFIFAYSIMSYLAMLFGLPVILAYIYYKTNSKKTIIGYLIIFFIFIGILFISSTYYKGFTIFEVKDFLSSDKFAHPSHTGFKLKNFPQYPFGMIDGFFHIDAKYDLPTYLSSVRSMEINSLFSVIFGLILGAITLILIFQGGIFTSLKNSIAKKELSLLAVSLAYFLSAAIPLIIFLPVYDKLWIMELHSFLLLGGVIYHKLKKPQLIIILFIVGVLIMAIFNFGFAIKSKAISEDIVCVEDSLNLMNSKYNLLITWGERYGKYFPTFFFNKVAKYYKIPSLAIENDMNTRKVITVLKNEFCHSESAFYVTSGVMMDEAQWNTFLGDEMKMDYSLFHTELLDHANKVTECVYELDRDICNT